MEQGSKHQREGTLLSFNTSFSLITLNLIECHWEWRTWRAERTSRTVFLATLLALHTQTDFTQRQDEMKRKIRSRCLASIVHHIAGICWYSPFICIPPPLCFLPTIYLWPWHHRTRMVFRKRCGSRSVCLSLSFGKKIQDGQDHPFRFHERKVSLKDWINRKIQTSPECSKG